jgi:hypothetical protein
MDGTGHRFELISEAKSEDDECAFHKTAKKKYGRRPEKQVLKSHNARVT